MRSLLIALVIIGVVGTATAFVPTASAQTAGDLQQQIRELLAKVAELTRQLNVLQAPVSNAPPPAPVPAVALKHRVCAALHRNLSRGVSGDDVRSLQEFLRERGYFSTNATGYYGPLTASAVTRWQAAEGVSAVGAFGPISRERIRAWCGLSGDGGGGGVNTEHFGASPLRGSAPLTVTFTANVQLANPQFVADAGDYKIVFGDGSKYALPCSGASSFCPGPHTVSHTYVSSGTYTASLVHYGYFGPPGPSGLPERTVGSATIYVGVASADPSADPRCRAWYDGCNTCSREYPGGPAACTLRYCVWQATAYCTAYFDDASANKPPVISGISGPTTLSVHQTGTWTMRASDPEGGALSYSITWGDEYRALPYAPASTLQSFVQTSTFTHAYASAGTYTITVVVRDNAGEAARTTTTVRVGTEQPVICTADAMRCPDGTYVGRTGLHCQFVCPGGVVYQ